ncbi:MAG: protein-L-isoaspartate(D-aspartate) O-methyltransferase [Hyphomicrobiales bacterium]|nr:MAG: protein-L-isoaspartate(D-aspartate) O-methyltransferase [Hyphomicrobiales bacterium]
MLAPQRERDAFVQRQIEARGIRDRRVLDAMRSVPRELFVPEDQRAHAYEDHPLPIGAGQTISQPYIVGFMIEALGLRGGEKVLEVGAGSGYAAAVLSKIAGEVFTIERIGALVRFATDNLAAAGCSNVHVRHGDGTQGWATEAPFDAILVSAGAPDVPPSLMHQLKVGGRLVIPVGKDPSTQELVRVTRTSDGDWSYEDVAGVRFVPLIGKEGWEDEVDGWQERAPRTRTRRSAKP